MSILSVLFSIFFYSIECTRLLPADGAILHCAGQSDNGATFTAYSKYLNDDTEPAIYMEYLGLGDSDLQTKFKDMETELEKFPKNQWVGIQIGLNFNGLSQDIADGKYTKNIQDLIAGMKSTGRPCWVRLGYEFNGQWNNYAPKDDYIKAFRRITSYFRNNSWA
eukprot:18163_1